MKVFMPVPREDWICDVIISEFRKYSKHEFVDDPHNADLIYLYAKWIWNHIPFGLLMSKPVITTVHHIVPHKTKNSDFISFDQFTDLYHVPNSHTATALQKLSSIKIKKVPYWINTERWKVLDDVEAQNDKLVLASFQRDTEGASIGRGLNPEPKFEKGPDIFADVVERFQPNELLVAIPGWRRDYLRQRLQRFDVMSSRAKLTNEMMNPLYNSIRCANGYYLVTSRYEGGPQAVLEAAQTRVKILSTDVGIAKDVLHPDCICRDVDEFEKKIKSLSIDHTVDYNFASVQNFAIDKLIHSYDDIMENMI